MASTTGMGHSTAASGTLSTIDARNSGAGTPTAGSPRTTPAPRAAGARYFPASRLRDHRLPHPVRPRALPQSQRARALRRSHQVPARQRSIRHTLRLTSPPNLQTTANVPCPVVILIAATVKMKLLPRRRKKGLLDAVETQTHQMDGAAGRKSAPIFKMSGVNQI